MPSKLEMPREANLLREDAVDFSELDPFREGKAKSDEGDEDEEEGEGEAEETPDEGEEAGEEEADAQTATDDPVFEIPGHGQIRASEVKNLLARSATATQIAEESRRVQAERGELEEAYQRLSPAIYIQELLDNQAIRDGFQRVILDVFKDADSLPASDGKGAEFFKGLPGKSSTQPEVSPQIRQELDEMKYQLAKREVDDLRSELSQANPSLVTDQFWQRVKDQAKALYSGDSSEHFGMRELRLVAERMVEAERAKRGPTKPAPPREKGVRLVAGHSSTRKSVTQPRLKDPRKMSEQELQDEFVHQSGSFVSTQED